MASINTAQPGGQDRPKGKVTKAYVLGPQAKKYFLLVFIK